MGFSSLLERDPETFLEAVKSQSLSLDEAVDSVLKLRDRLGALFFFFQYEILLSARKVGSKNFRAVAELFGVDEELARQLLENDLVLFDFPVLQANKADLANGIVVCTDRTFTNAVMVQRHVEQTSKILGKNFSVVFDREIVDSSFMLSLYVAIESRGFDGRYTFSGGLDTQLNVLPAEMLSEKQKACERKNKILISSSDFQNAREILDFLALRRYDAAFLVCFSNKRDQTYLEASYQKLAQKAGQSVKREVLEKVSASSLIYSGAKLEKKDFVIEINKLYKVLSRVMSSNVVPHIAFIGPSSLAMGLGAMLGCQNPIAVYHYENNEYHRVVDLRKGTRKIKVLRDVRSLRRVVFEESGQGRDCAFLIQFSSHSPLSDAEKFLSSKRLSAKIVRVFHREVGGIPISDWSEEVSELMSIVQYFKSREHFRRFHFFMSVPVPIAFAFGMAFGHFAKASVYQFTSHDELPYFEAVRLEELMI